MTSRAARKPSPLLSAASGLITEASSSLVTAASRFRHSFEVAVEAISPDPDQPRRAFSDEDIAGLAVTMEEQGQLQPILLRRDPAAADRWIIVAGERRWRAVRRNNWPTLLAIETDGDPQVTTILENLQRVDLSPVEEARGIQRLIARKGWTQERAAEVLGRSRGEISATLRILTLPEAVQEAVLTSELELPRNVLVELARLEPVQRDALLDRARRDGLTVQTIRKARPAAPGLKPVLPPKPGPRAMNLTVLDRATDEVEAAIHQGARMDGRTRKSLERLHESVAALLRAQSGAPTHR